MLKALDGEAAMPVIATEIAKKEFTLEDVRTIFSAIGVAENETGDNYREVKAKLYKLFPELKREHDRRNVAWKLMGQRQTRARKNMAAKLATTLDRKQPLIPQIEKWVEENYPGLHDSYSDETCVAADLYRYHLKLVPVLARELRAAARKNQDAYYAERKNSETWLYLSHLLEAKAIWQKYAKDANGRLQLRKLPPARG